MQGKRKKMPSIQTALPTELADNVIRLYRECLRRARYVGHQQHNTELVVDMVRQQFRKHMHEIDPMRIQKLKDDAARGLINHILYESEKITGRKFSGSKDFGQESRSLLVRFPLRRETKEADKFLSGRRNSGGVVEERSLKRDFGQESRSLLVRFPLRREAKEADKFLSGRRNSGGVVEE
ncbi:hypothetical protein KSP39_PZI004317 [Platanthera zijinensis]|uniref:Complex 1 LYR protein domain-containing protein n=1 Tax=Platanthera zijinensis TaxID=2320716 RepID=A0AAP0BX03_9ASPA